MVLLDKGGGFFFRMIFGWFLEVVVGVQTLMGQSKKIICFKKTHWQLSFRKKNKEIWKNLASFQF